MFTNFPRQPLWVRTGDETQLSAVLLSYWCQPCQPKTLIAPKKLENIKQIKRTVDFYCIMSTSWGLSIKRESVLERSSSSAQIHFIKQGIFNLFMGYLCKYWKTSVQIRGKCGASTIYWVRMGIDVGRRKRYAQLLAGGRHSTCLRHRVSRSAAGTQVKSCSVRGGTAFLLSVLHAGVRTGRSPRPLRTSSLAYRCYGPHRMLVFGEQKLPLRNCLRCLASYTRSPTCGHLGWAPTCFARRGLGGRHLLLQPETPEVSSHCLGRAALPSFDSAWADMHGCLTRGILTVYRFCTLKQYYKGSRWWDGT